MKVRQVTGGTEGLFPGDFQKRAGTWCRNRSAPDALKTSVRINQARRNGGGIVRGSEAFAAGNGLKIERVGDPDAGRLIRIQNCGDVAPDQKGRIVSVASGKFLRVRDPFPCLFRSRLDGGIGNGAGSARTGRLLRFPLFRFRNRAGEGGEGGAERMGVFLLTVKILGVLGDGKFVRFIELAGQIPCARKRIGERLFRSQLLQSLKKEVRIARRIELPVGIGCGDKDPSRFPEHVKKGGAHGVEQKNRFTASVCV